jgi:hypothetical protein
VTVVVEVAIQPFESVTVTTYVPATRFEAVCVTCAGLVFHKYVYGGVPPLGLVTVTLPLFPPKQPTFVKVEAITLVIALGCVTVVLAVVIDPLESVTVTVYTPAFNPVAVCVV